MYHLIKVEWRCHQLSCLTSPTNLLGKLTYKTWHVTFWHGVSMVKIKLCNKQSQNLSGIQQQALISLRNLRTSWFAAALSQDSVRCGSQGLRGPGLGRSQTGGWLTAAGRCRGWAGWSSVALLHRSPSPASPRCVLLAVREARANNPTPQAPFKPLFASCLLSSHWANQVTWLSSAEEDESHRRSEELALTVINLLNQRGRIKCRLNTNKSWFVL